MSCCKICRGAQVVLVGNGRGYLSAIITGAVTREQAQAEVDAVNRTCHTTSRFARFTFTPNRFPSTMGCSLRTES